MNFMFSWQEQYLSDIVLTIIDIMTIIDIFNDEGMENTPLESRM